MQMANNEQNDDERNEASSIAKFSGMAFQMIAVIGLFTYAGYKIDTAASHNVKWVTAILSLAGVCISIYIVIKSLNNK